MKYIRLENTIYEIDNDNNLIFRGKKIPLDSSKLVGYKLADSIEELCDEFALFYMEIKNATPIPYATYERRGVWRNERLRIIKEIVNHPSSRQPILYGAIWTNQGLKYVAKMNSKGELELI